LIPDTTGPGFLPFISDATSELVQLRITVVLSFTSHIVSVHGNTRLIFVLSEDKRLISHNLEPTETISQIKKYHIVLSGITSTPVSELTIFFGSIFLGT